MIEIVLEIIIITLLWWFIIIPMGYGETGLLLFIGSLVGYIYGLYKK